MLELKLKYHERKCGEMTYDECLEVATQAERILADLSPFDIAVETFAQQRIDFYNYAGLIALRDDNPRVEHFLQFPVTYSWGDEVQEGIALVPKSNSPRIQGTALDLAIRGTIMSHHDWNQSTNRNVLEFVVGEQIIP